MKFFFKKPVLFIIVFFQLSVATAHIDFHSLSIDQALSKAESEGKLVFIDIYATWCGPCKVMDRVFGQKAVGAYFNSNFVNIKVDMDGPLGAKMLNEYQVVWLPTLLILDPHGTVKGKVDRLVSGDELIRIAEEALAGHSSNSPSTSPLHSNPFPNAQDAIYNQDYDPSSKEEVIYVHDQRESSGRPHIMYHEAYLHLQLMDGKHQKVVKKYLSTQEDWSSEKNIKFIFDFLQDVHSPQFSYFIENIEHFRNIIGVDKVNKSLEMLVNQRLEQGYPRPSLPEAQRLYSHMSQSQADVLAYKYYLKVQHDDHQTLEYINTALQYLNLINPYDHRVMCQLVTFRLDRSDYKAHLAEDLERMLFAVSLDESSPEYRYILSKLYFHLNQKEKASESIDRAIELAEQQDRSPKLFLDYKQQVLQL